MSDGENVGNDFAGFSGSKFSERGSHNMDCFKVWLSYLKRHRHVLMAVVCVAAIFVVIFSLYSLPMEPLIYAGALSAAAFALIGFISYLGFRRRHEYLTVIRRRIGVELAELPIPESATEEDYQQILKELNGIRMELVSKADGVTRDMTDYYTLWAHQIKTPIAAMRLILQSRDDPRDGEIQAELFKIEQYVEMVMGYLRLGSETSDFVLERRELDSIIRGSLRKFARIFIMKKLSIDFRETGLKVLTDEKWLSFVIEQILSNALKYTKSGCISIYSEDMTLVIKDTGIGISPEDLPRICEKGYTGYNGRADKKSSGLGLYLCSSILKKLGHTLTIDSQVGEGTSVRIGLESRELMVD